MILAAIIAAHYAIAQEDMDDAPCGEIVDETTPRVLPYVPHPTRIYPNPRYEPCFYIEMPDVTGTTWGGAIGERVNYDIVGQRIDLTSRYAEPPRSNASAGTMGVYVWVAHYPGGTAWQLSNYETRRHDEFHAPVEPSAPPEQVYVYRVRLHDELEYGTVEYTIAPELAESRPAWFWPNHANSRMVENATEALYRLLEIESGNAKYCDKVTLHVEADWSVQASGENCRIYLP